MRIVLQSGIVKHKTLLQREKDHYIESGSTLENNVFVHVKQGRLSRTFGMSPEELRDFCKKSLAMLDDIENEKSCSVGCHMFAQENSPLCSYCEKEYESNKFGLIVALMEKHGNDVSKWSNEIIELVGYNSADIQKSLDNIKPRGFY